MSYSTVGTCSICSGPVMIPTLWGSIVPPTPTCSRCGAIAASHGPVIPMVKPYNPPAPKCIKDYLEQQGKSIKDYSVPNIKATKISGTAVQIRQDYLLPEDKENLNK